MTDIIVKKIKEKDIPKSRTQKASIVPKLLEQINRGEVGVFTDTDDLRIVTIRGYIEKEHRTGQLKQFKVKQRTTGEKPNQTKTLYVIHESPKP